MLIQAKKTLALLINERIQAKRNEDAAIEARRVIDSEIAVMLQDPGKPEGTVSVKEGEHKVSVVYGITRNADTDGLQKAWKSLSAAVQQAFKFKAEVLSGAYKKLEGADAKLAAKFVTSKPSSPSVKVELA